MFVCALLLFASNSQYDLRANGQGKVDPAKAGAALGRFIGKHIKVQVNSFGDTKHYVGFPPREIVLQGSKRFDELNLYVDVPGKPWTCFVPQKKGSIDTIQLSRVKPRVDILLAIEQIGHLRNYGSRAHAKELEARLLSRVPKAEILPGMWAIEAGDYSGVCFEAVIRQEKGNQELHWIWGAVRDDHTYTLVVTGDRDSRLAIEKAAADFLGRIRPIEHVKVDRPQVKWQIDSNVAWASDHDSPPERRKNK